MYIKIFKKVFYSCILKIVFKTDHFKNKSVSFIFLFLDEDLSVKLNIGGQFLEIHCLLNIKPKLVNHLLELLFIWIYIRYRYTY